MKGIDYAFDYVETLCFECHKVFICWFTDLLIYLNPYLPLVYMIAKANKFQQNPKMKEL